MITLALSLLGTEVARLKFGRPPEPPTPPRLEASGGGQFEIGGFGFEVGDHHSPPRRS